MNPTTIFLYLSIFLHIHLLIVAGQYSPVDHITVACGSSGQNSSPYDPRNWTGDIDSKLFPIEAGNTNATSQSKKAPSSPSATEIPYTRARLSHSEFTYRFPLSPGQKFIRLYFNPASYPDFDRTKSLFSVTAAGFTLLKDFNASVNADVDGNQKLMREFCVNVETEQSLSITFTPTKDAYAFINGIEVISMPTGFYYISSGHNLGSDNPYPITNTRALEMVYRINVGGASIDPKDDTGMYRSWESQDDRYLDERSRIFSVLPQNNTIELNYVTVPNYSAPKNVYNTGRSMGMDKATNKNYNLTWSFHVHPQFYYLVRLHFCEFEPTITRYGDRSFQIYMANQTAEKHADIIGWSKGNGNPYYRDYIVFMPSRGSKQKKVDLFLALSALQKDWYTAYNDAILNGLEIFKLSLNGNLAGPNPDPLPVTIPNPDPPPPKATLLLAIIAGVVSTVLVLSVLGFFVFRRRRQVKDTSSSHGTKWGPFSFATTKSTKSHGSSLPSNLCRHFSLAEIKTATKNFNEIFIIGVGGFGNVYKGYIDDGSTPVAIKRLKPESSQGAHEFKMEIELLSQLRHRHLVSLVGHCTDKGEMILVYDYMEQGTLRDHLYQTHNPPLPWERRLQICIGTTKGLQYLHGGAKGTIIHRDVKSTNILLDGKWMAKVSDFGLSKMGTLNMSNTHISTVVKGSFGYLDPEYYRRQRLTEKSDVYSFGVVLFEVLCARPAVINTTEIKQMNLAEWVKTCHHNGELDQIIDPSLTGKIATESLNKFVDIALSCVQDNGVERPSMNDILRGLELALQIQQSSEKRINSFERKGEIEMSNSEQSCAAENSITCISRTIFSEIKNPNGR